MHSVLSYLETLSDARLVKHFMHGSQLAFYVLVQRHNPHLKVYLHTLLHNATKESETLQKLWIKIMELLRQHRYHEKGHFKQWLNTQLFWLAGKTNRGKKRFISLPDQDIPDEPDAEAEDYTNEEYIRFFNEELSKMPEREQQIVKLRLEQDKTFPEIDAILHLKDGESRVYFWRVMKHLKALYKSSFRQ